MSTLSLTLPTIGQPNSTEDVDIVNAFTAIQNEYNTNVANLMGAWRPLFLAQGGYLNPTAAGTLTMFISGGNVGMAQHAFYLDNTGFAVSSYTCQIRLVTMLSTNAVSLGTQTITPGLYPITAVGGTGSNHTFTLGTVTLANAATVNPATSTLFNLTSSTLTMPSSGYYCPAVVTTATVAANASFMVNMMCQYRYV